MSARKHRLPHEGPMGGFTFPDGKTTRPKRDVEAPDIDICSYSIVGISPAFDPNRVLLRRVFFISEDKSKYVSVGSTLHTDISLGSNLEDRKSEQQVTALAQHLPPLCDALCANILFFGQLRWILDKYDGQLHGRLDVSRPTRQHLVQVARTALPQ